MKTTLMLILGFLSISSICAQAFQPTGTPVPYHQVSHSAELTKFLSNGSFKDTFRCGDEVEYAYSGCRFQVDSTGCSSGCELPIRWTPVSWTVTCDPAKPKVRKLHIEWPYGVKDYVLDEKEFIAREGNAVEIIWGQFFNPKNKYKTAINGAGSEMENVYTDADGSSKPNKSIAVSGTVNIYSSSGQWGGSVDMKGSISTGVPGIGQISSIEMCGDPLLRFSKVLKRGQ